ncbi:MAG: hypothetical protein ACRBK7_13085 [Acidimicrobiales bacterium]
MKTKFYLFAALFAVAALVSACGSDDATTTEAEASTEGADTSGDGDGDSSSDTDDGDAMGDEDHSGDDDAMTDDDAMAEDEDAMSDDAMADEDAMSEDDDAMTDDDEAMAEDAGLDFTFISLIWPEGSQPSPEVFACLDDKGVDPEMSLLSATEEESLEAVVVLYGCAPDELATVFADDVDPPAGTTREDTECVIAETFRYMGTLPVAEAMEITNSSDDDIPDAISEEVIPIAKDVCGLDEDQITAIFEA